MRKTSFWLSMVAIGTASVMTASAITYSVGDWSQQFPGPVTPPAGAPHSLDGYGYPGDTVTLGSGSGSFDLVNGAVYYNMPIGTLDWGVDYTYNGTATAWDYPANWPNLIFTINALRSITIGGTSAGNISQSGTLTSTWDNDFLSFSAGPMSSVYVQGYRVDITPNFLPDATVEIWHGGNPPAGGYAQPSRNMTATFEVHYVPDGGMTLALLGLALTGLAGLRRKLSL